jgi:hypothetical protein
LAEESGKKELKKFLEEKIAAMKKEIEYYEYLLALLESGYEKKEAEEGVEEVTVDKKVIAIIRKEGRDLVLTMLFKPDKDPSIISFLKNQVALLVPGSSVIVEDGDKIEKIVVKDVRGGKSVTTGVIEALKISATELYRKVAR